MSVSNLGVGWMEREAAGGGEQGSGVEGRRKRVAQCEAGWGWGACETSNRGHPGKVGTWV